MNRIRDFRKGGKAREAAHFQELVTALRTLGVGKVDNQPPGVNIILKRRLGIIVSSGPNGEADYGDERYWVQFSYIEGAGINDAVSLAYELPVEVVIPSDPTGAPEQAEQTLVTATNIDEYGAGSHCLPTNGTEAVWVWEVWDKGDGWNLPHAFFSRAVRDVPVKITSIIASAGSKYAGRTAAAPPAADVATSGDATDADLGTVVGANDCLVIDANEIGRANSSHLNAVGTYHNGRLIRANADGTKVVQINSAPVDGELFYVALTQTGGADGNKTTAATWTYTVTAPNGETLGTVMGPAIGRPNGSVTAATKGVAYYDAGTLVLLQAFERPATGGCS